MTTVARGRISSRSASTASSASSRAPDSATITGSCTTGVPGAQLVERRGDGLDRRDVAEHPDLHGVDAEVLGDRPDLADDDLRRRPPGRPLTRDRVLHRDRRDRRRPVHAGARERLEVGLDPGAAAGVRPGDRQGDGHAAIGHRREDTSHASRRGARSRARRRAARRPLAPALRHGAHSVLPGRAAGSRAARAPRARP